MTGRRRQAGRRTGFTLVELMVALAISGVVVLTAHAVVAFASDSATRLRESKRDALSGASARATVSAWLRLARLADGDPPFTAIRRRSGDRPLDELGFTVGDGGPAHPGPHRIRFWVAPRTGAARGALLAELRRVRGGMLAAPETVLVAPDVAGLTVRYLARSGRRERWVELWDSETTLPVAVELTALHDAVAGMSGSGAPLLGMPLVAPIGWSAP